MNGKKMAAPIIITVLLVMLLLGYLCLWTVMPSPLLFKAVIFLILAAFIGVSVYNLVTRINEIRSGEEDDLSKY